MIRMSFFAALAMLLASCAGSPAPAIQTKTVDVSVPIPVVCTPKLDPQPTFPDDDATLAALDAKADVLGEAKVIRAGRALRDAWIAEQAAALKGCGG